MFYVLWALGFTIRQSPLNARDAFVYKNRTIKTKHNKGWEDLEEMSEFSTQQERWGQKMWDRSLCLNITA